MTQSDETSTIAPWMGDVDPSQLGFPFEIDRSRYEKQPGLVYKKTATGDQHLDFYRPLGTTEPPPLILMIHGGGWRGGGRYQMGLTRWAGYLAASGLAVASIDYRLAPETTYPDSFQDCLDALDWTVDQAATLGINSNRIGLWGDSAGGHLALLLGTSQTREDYPGPRARTPADRIQAVVALYPPTDLVALHEAERRFHDGPTATASFVGVNPEDNGEVWGQVSPIEQVHKQTPPTLILQGTRDLLVPHQQAVDYAAQAKRVGAPHELHLVENAVHGFDRVAPDSEARRLIERSRDFLLNQLTE